MEDTICAPNPVDTFAWTRPSWNGPHMHKSCYEWVGRIVAEYHLADKATIEIGSQNVNGTIRDHFSGPYIGVDLLPGNGVDRTEDSEALSDDDATWAVVVSVEMLEHCQRPWRAVAEMARICEPNGYVIASARGYDDRGCWEVHAYPHDYWRVSSGAMRVMAEDAGLNVLEVSVDPEGPGFFLLATKP